MRSSERPREGEAHSSGQLWASSRLASFEQGPELRETPKGTAFSHERGQERRPFLCAPYLLAGNGAPPAAAQGIRRCPSAQGSAVCAVTKDGFRKRVTGPGFRLQVMSCKPHGHFTVYPMGFVPHGRTAVAPVSFSGEAHGGDLDAAPAIKWRRSIFEAPVALAVGPAWQRELGRTDRLQGRHTEVAAKILGLSRDLDPAMVERIRGILDLAGLDHEKARRDFASARDCARRAAALVPLLDLVVLDDGLCGRVLSAGFQAGLWGRPLLFDVRTGTVFPSPGTAPASAPRQASAAPHESVPEPPGAPPNLSPSASAARQVPPPCLDVPSP